MKKLLLVAISTTLLGLFSYANDFTNHTEKYPIKKMHKQNKEIIEIVVEKVSTTLPQIVDKYTTLTAIQSDQLTLVYSFDIDTKSKSDKDVKEEDQSRMYKAITKGVCKSAKPFLDIEITIIYKYFNSKTKNKLFAFTMNKKICNKIKNI